LASPPVSPKNHLTQIVPLLHRSGPEAFVGQTSIFAVHFVRRRSRSGTGPGRRRKAERRWRREASWSRSKAKNFHTIPDGLRLSREERGGQHRGDSRQGKSGQQPAAERRLTPTDNDHQGLPSSKLPGLIQTAAAFLHLQSRLVAKSYRDCQKFFLIADFLNPPKSPFFKGGLLKQFR
jgi:hypothetical protein